MKAFLIRSTMAVVCGMTSIAANASSVACTLVDNFNRADSTTIGGGWTEQVGDLSIQGNKAGNVNGAAATNLMSVAAGPGPDDGVCLDVFAGTAGALSYAAVALKYVDAYNNVFEKLQDNDGDGLFDSIVVVQGNNGSPWGSGSREAFQRLSNPCDWKRSPEGRRSS